MVADAELKAEEFSGAPAEDRLYRMRHSAAHIMAQAVVEMMPEAKLAIGPPIDWGFYYDFLLPRPLTPDDLPAIEARMRQVIAADVPFEESRAPKEEARRIFADQPFKLELIDSFEGDDVGLSRHDTFLDLCRGRHVDRSGEVGAFKLMNIAGAYWRGDEKRSQLTRIYGALFVTQDELDGYLKHLEEARARDHRRLGRDLDLFFFDELAPGQPFWLPKGIRIIRELESLLQKELDRRGYLEISSPSLVKADLWKQSGHWDYYEHGMFKLQVDEEDYGFKPMNCPESTIVYRSKLRSYRDLPLRLSQTDRLLRNERSGTLNGLLRVRQITMDDAHIFCREDQIQAEIGGVLAFQQAIYGVFGFEPQYYLSTRPEKALGDLELWQRAEGYLRDALDQNGITYEVKEGEGAFYGPKIDVDIVDALGRPWQLNTTQLDFNLPERFGLEYIGDDGQPHRPVMVHRAIYGSYERFMAVLIEHYGGAFPLWLAPVQAVVIPIADRHNEYAFQVQHSLQEAGLRVEVDHRTERMNAKIRDAQLQKVPYMLVVGDREAEAGAAAVRLRSGEDLKAMPVGDIVVRMTDEVARKA
jgi:threonyl-tRNA synthetase